MRVRACVCMRSYAHTFVRSYAHTFVRARGGGGEIVRDTHTHNFGNRLGIALTETCE